MTYRLGFDIGGTFTDLFLFDESTGTLEREKVSTTPDDFSRGALEGIDRILDGRTSDDVTHVAHGTTVATNALLERTGVETGLITTEGFRDVLAIGRENREQFYDLSPAKIPTFVDRPNRIGVSERIDAHGEIVVPLEESDVEAAVDELVENGVESIAVSLIHAYLNDEHERRIAAIARERSDRHVSISSDVRPEILEYERTLSTVLNASLEPIVQAYVEQLESGLGARGIDGPLHLMQANGGVITLDTLEGRIIKLINSGPTAGVLGAKRAAKRSGISDVITLDMGGTSADACIVRDGEIETTTEGEIDSIPLLYPQVDVRTIGAGGGSIAWVGRGDRLKVGPKSAGADPGPACYGRGGTEPTVTDAALILGHLHPDTFLGGEMDIDEDAAWDALSGLGEELKQDDTRDLAEGILDIATTKMRRAIRMVTVEKGYDPRDFCLTCFGGAGPIFVSRLGRDLDLKRALIPTAPGVLSAFGLSVADKRHNFSRSEGGQLEAFEPDEITGIYEVLDREAREVAGEDVKSVRSADMRYGGQRSTITVDLPPGDVTEVWIDDVRDHYDRQYESIFGYSMPEDVVEVLTWRLRTTESLGDVELPPIDRDGSVEDAIKGRREVYEDGKFHDTVVYDRHELPPGAAFDGPAVIEETESTTIADSGSHVRVDDVGNLLIDL